MFQLIGLALASAAMRCFAAFFANGSHMLPILANGFPAFSPSLAGFIGGKFMRYTLLMRCASTHTGNSPLFSFIHGSKATQALLTAVPVISVGWPVFLSWLFLLHFPIFYPLHRLFLCR